MVMSAATGVCLLLALIAATRGDDTVAECTQTDVTELKDALRQSACRLNANRTAGEEFRAAVRTKHGRPDATSAGDFFVLANLFRISTYKAWCRTTCPDIAPENVTWCIQIAYLERNVEVCVKPGAANSVVVTNISCEAELVALPNYLSFPEDCQHFGVVGCLGLTNLDWFFQEAYMTCIVTTDTCSDKSFTQLLTQARVAQPPEFDLFPTSPQVVLPSDTMVLHAEISTNHLRTVISWQHDDKLYNSVLFEDPFCNVQLEECINDTHPDAPSLRQQRIRVYRTTRIIDLDGCRTSRINRLECYLIVDNVREEDSGEYSLNVTVTPPGFSSITVTRSVNASIVCQPQPFEATCTHSHFSVEDGARVKWECQLTAAPDTNFSLLLNNTNAMLPNEQELECGSEPQVLFFIQEEKKHVCFSGFNVTVKVCSVSESVVGEFTINSSSGEVSTDTKVVVRLEQDEPTVSMPTPEGSKSGSVSPVVYATPLSTLVVVLVMLVVLLIVVLRGRKRRRDRRVTTRMQSPSLKEAAFFKEEEALRSCPASPLIGNGILEDPLEFPRNRLYIYCNKVLGEGSFGRVLQAKAEGIVPGMPERNMVAIKTTKENATSVEREELLAELQLMREMEPHENILNLLGQCTTGGGPLCLIVEFATYGNLRDFLRQCEEVVLSLNHLPHIPRNRSRTRTFSASSCGSAQPLIVRQDSVFTPSSGHTHFVFPTPSGHASSGSGSSSSGEGKLMAHHPDTAPVPLAHSVTPIGHDYINTKGLVYMEDVHNFALQIACGLQHLASMQIVHCDLAARNVLIAEGFVLKIADFGLARDISGRELYKKNPRGKIPVKWTAPEALEHRIFTISSDVWSYGVLLWELFTYGHTPYPEVSLGTSYEPFISYLKDGNRMQQPESCPTSFYEMMLQCWQLEPSLRPAPHDLVAQLTPADSIFDDADSELNAEPQMGSNKSDSTGSGAGHQSSQE